MFKSRGCGKNDYRQKKWKQFWDNEKTNSNFNPGANYQSFDYRHMEAPKNCNCESKQATDGSINVAIFVLAIAAAYGLGYMIGKISAPKIASDNN